MGQRTFRQNASLVLPPNTEVLLCGGVGNPQDDATAVFAPEMLVPDGVNWKWDAARRAPATFVRNYYSTALLMPDGRVFTGGSNINAGPGPEAQRRLQLEIYEPWYVCRPRPRIVSSNGSVRSGARLVARIKSPLERVTRLVLMRCGSATHAFNPDQRCVSMIARQLGSGEEFAGIVPAPVVAIPG